MAAVVAAVRHHENHGNGRQRNGNGPAGQGLKTVSPFGGSTTEDDAALVIQRAAFPRLIAPDRTGARVMPVPPECARSPDETLRSIVSEVECRISGRRSYLCVKLSLPCADRTHERLGECDGRAETKGAPRTSRARAGPTGC